MFQCKHGLLSSHHCSGPMKNVFKNLWVIFLDGKPQKRTEPKSLLQYLVNSKVLL